MNKIILDAISVDDLLVKFREVVDEVITQRMTEIQNTMFISTAEVQKLFSPTISKPTIFSYVRKGYLRSYWVGGKMVFNKGEVINDIKKIKVLANG